MTDWHIEKLMNTRTKKKTKKTQHRLLSMLVSQMHSICIID